MDPRGGQYVTPNRLHDGGERHRAGSDAVRQRRGIDRDPLTGEGVALPVQRLVQHELRHQHARQQVGAGEAARNGVGRRRRLGHGLAVAARHLLAHVLDDLPAPRLAFQRARHHLAELAQPRSAAPVASARDRVDDPLHREVLGQLRPGRARGTAFACRGSRLGHGDVGLGFRRTLAFLDVGDGQFELLDEELAAFGRRAVLLPAQLGDQELQLLGLEPPDHGFAAQRHDHGMSAGEVGRERISGCRHTAIRSQPSAAASLFAIQPGPDARSAAGSSSRSLP